jgi:hypothetical protein
LEHAGLSSEVTYVSDGLQLPERRLRRLQRSPNDFWVQRVKPSPVDPALTHNSAAGSSSPPELFPGKQLDFQKNEVMISPMALPTEPVTLNVVQIEELNRKLSALRHDVNNHLMLITTAVELIRLKPENRERMLTMMGEQPQKIGGAITQFSTTLESALHITRP